MELAFDTDRHRGLFANLIRNGKDRSFGSRHGLLCSADCDISGTRVLRGPVNVDLGVGIVFNLIDGSTAFTQDARNRTSRNGELQNII
jgi:hypothetical protein